MIRRLLCITGLALMIAGSALAQQTGSIVGRVTNLSGEGVGGVAVILNELSRATTTDPNGAFRFDRVPVGTYSLSFASGEQSDSLSGVSVTGDGQASVEHQLPWALTFAESITVYSASRRTERIVEAPAAVTVITEEELELASPTGQLPKVLEGATGVDFTQSGLYDFNFNTRGFNSSLNRR